MYNIMDMFKMGQIPQQTDFIGPPAPVNPDKFGGLFNGGQMTNQDMFKGILSGMGGQKNQEQPQFDNSALMAMLSNTQGYQPTQMPINPIHTQGRRF